MLCRHIIDTNVAFSFILIHLNEVELILLLRKQLNKSWQVSLVHASIMWKPIASYFRSWHTYAKWLWFTLLLSFFSIFDRIRAFRSALQMYQCSVPSPSDVVFYNILKTFANISRAINISIPTKLNLVSCQDFGEVEKTPLFFMFIWSWMKKRLLLT